MCQKYLKNVCFVKCLVIWITFYPNTRVVSENTQTRILKLLEKWRSAVDKEKLFGTLLADR